MRGVVSMCGCYVRMLCMPVCLVRDERYGTREAIELLADSPWGVWMLCARAVHARVPAMIACPTRRAIGGG